MAASRSAARAASSSPPSALQQDDGMRRVEEYLRLAGELRKCVDARSAKWRKLELGETSRLVTRKARCSGASNQQGGYAQRSARREMRAQVTRASQLQCTRLPDLAEARMVRVANYLNQPELVREMLDDEEQTEMAMATRGEDTVESCGIVGSAIASPSASACDVALLPESVDADNKGDVNSVGAVGGVRLPLLRAMSTRSRENLARLPPPSAEDAQLILEMERHAEQNLDPSAMYMQMQRRRRKQRLAGIVPNTTDPRSSTRLQQVRGKANDMQVSQLGVAKQISRMELACMALEDIDAPVYSPGACGTQVGSLTHFSKAQQRLLHEQAMLNVQQAQTNSRLTTTLTEIKHWIPLDVLYDFGLGTCASAAQQRATQCIARIKTRIVHHALARALAQWKQADATLCFEQRWHAALVLECWWRRMQAISVVASQRRLRNALMQRQQHYLHMLAHHQDRASMVLSNAMRRYANRTSQRRAQRFEQAARVLQHCWRQRHALWQMLHRRLLQRQRREAAALVQRSFRRFLRLRRFRLIAHIACAEQLLARRRAAQLARHHDRFRLGATLVLQRAIRTWLQSRIQRLRQRRARFDRHVHFAVRMQAWWRGQCARRYCRRHRLAVQHSVLTLQCWWRCMQADRVRADRERQRQQQREHWRAEIAARRRQHRQLLNVKALAGPTSWRSMTIRIGGVAGVDSKDKDREQQAAARLQAQWRGIRVRRRLRHEKARACELERRQARRRRMAAATCVQRHARGRQARQKVRRRLLDRSALRVQSAWRGHCVRRNLAKWRAAENLLRRAQAQWKQRRLRLLFAHRVQAASVLQRLVRRHLARHYRLRLVQQQQRREEERALGQALAAMTRSRVLDDLLLQSLVYPELGQRRDDQDATEDDQDGGNSAANVQRSLYKLDAASKRWQRRGYCGLWQRVFRDMASASFELDNSRLVRFLKALPSHFVNARTFPAQGVDVLFASMKPPHARAISFATYSKLMVRIWQAKWAPGRGDSVSGVPVSLEQEQAWYLRFMHSHVLPSSLQQGRYRVILAQDVDDRLLWCARRLQRFGERIRRRQQHEYFVATYQERQLRAQQHSAAQVIQSAYRGVLVRRRLKLLMAKMVVQVLDHQGRTVRWEHATTRRRLAFARNRPRFLDGVTCARVIKLPYPGEEFHAYCARQHHRDHGQQVPANVYCIECEEAVCSHCFANDHEKRAAWRKHQQRAILLCAHCRVETATRVCRVCGNGQTPYCDACYAFLHEDSTASATSPSLSPAPAPSPAPSPTSTHRVDVLVVLCVECEARVAQWRCETCKDVYCKRCQGTTHAHGQRQTHSFQRLSYWSILQPAAEHQRELAAQQQRDKRRAEQAAQRLAQAQERERRERSAVRIQAMVRSHQVRKRAQAYMKLVRQTGVATAQRRKDDRVRKTWRYQIKHLVAREPPLPSDTTKETALRQERRERIQAALHLHWKAASTKDKPRTRKEQRALELAAETWCQVDTRVQVVRGAWRQYCGEILSRQHLLLNGHVAVFLTLPQRVVVVPYTDLRPYDEEALLRQPHVPATRVLGEAAQTFHHRLTLLVAESVRRARLLYLQTIEFHDVVQFAWVVEANKQAPGGLEYWNVVMNKRVQEMPKALTLLERMDDDKRDHIEKRVAVAKRKLEVLLDRWNLRDKPLNALRRCAIIQPPRQRMRTESSKQARLREQIEALQSARFWHEVVLTNTALRRRALQFLAACECAPHSSTDCWRIVQVMQSLEQEDSTAFVATTKLFLALPAEYQFFTAGEIATSVEHGDWETAREDWTRLVKLKLETFQLLVVHDQQQAEADAEADAAAQAARKPSVS